VTAVLSRTEVRAGESLTVTAQGLEVAKVEIGIASTYRALATADVTDGALRATVTIPADITPGEHHIQLRDGDRILAELPVTVRAAAGALAATGQDTAPLMSASLFGAAMLGLGILAMLRLRARARRSEL
jgi:arabinoxylan arabinofuranohydrolase